MNSQILYKWVSLKLLVLCIIIFIIQITIKNFTENFAMISALILYRPWTIITSIFLHGGISHLFYNMFALALFGTILEKIIGGKRFLLLFLTAGVMASIGAALFYDAAIGASGAIFGILGCLTVLRPKMIVFVGWIPMPIAVAAVFWAIGDLIGMFVPSGIANAAHLFGLAFGLVFGFLFRQTFKEPLLKKRKDIEEISDEEIDEWESRWM